MLLDFGDGLVDHLGDLGLLQPQRQRTREIEEARDQRIGAVHFGGNESGHFVRHGAIGVHVLAQHLGRGFDGAQGIADFVRQSGRELAESGQALGAAHCGFGLLQVPVGFRQLFRRNLRFARRRAIRFQQFVGEKAGDRKGCARRIPARAIDRRHGRSRRDEQDATKGKRRKPGRRR